MAELEPMLKKQKFEQIEQHFAWNIEAPMDDSSDECALSDDGSGVSTKDSENYNEFDDSEVDWPREWWAKGHDGLETFLMLVEADLEYNLGEWCRESNEPFCCGWVMNSEPLLFLALEQEQSWI